MTANSTLRTTLRIRPALAGDMCAVSSVLARAYGALEDGFPWPNEWPVYLNDVVDVSARWDTSRRFVAEVEGVVVGSVDYYAPGTGGYHVSDTLADVVQADELDRTHFPDGWACFRYLAVDPGWQGAGIGVALLDHMIGLAADQGASHLALHTLDIMTSAVRLYEAKGFSRLPGHDFAPMAGSSRRAIAYLLPIRRTFGLTDELAAELRREVTGRVVTEADADWDAERLGWNLAVDQRPAAVVHVAHTADVIAAVRFAKRHGRAVSAQPVGHGTTRAVDDTILLRTGKLREVTVDIPSGTATVGAGVRWRALNEALDGTGLSGLPGSSGDTTVVGYTLGGGMSWFGRKHGVAANHVRRIELVDAEGKLHNVTASTDPDLFWALRGGGGDFGIVTEMEVELVFAPRIYGGQLVWPIERAAEVLEVFKAVTDTAPDELAVWYRLMNMPGLSVVAVDIAFLGTPEAAEPLLAPLREVAPPVSDTLVALLPSQLGTIASEPEEPVPAMLRAELLTGLDADAREAVLDAFAPGYSSPVGLVSIRHLGGRFACADEGGGAVAHVAEPFLLLYGGLLGDQAAGEALGRRVAEIERALDPYTSGMVPPNLSEDQRPDRLYPPVVLDRLRATKMGRDPRGVIRGNHPVA